MRARELLAVAIAVGAIAFALSPAPPQARAMDVVSEDNIRQELALSSTRLVLTQGGLDAISSTRGAILYRGASGWAALPPGTSGHFLRTAGASADPAWAAQTASKDGCRVSNAGDQSIANTTMTTLTWDTEGFDSDAYHSTSSNQGRLTCPSGKDGFFEVVTSIWWAANATGYRVIAAEKYNSSNALQEQQLVETALGGAALVHQGVFHFDLVAGDYVLVRTSQESGGSLAVNGDTTAGAGNKYTKVLLLRKSAS